MACPGLPGSNHLNYILSNFDAFARKQNMGWLSKKRQLQSAQLSSNEEYLGTPKR